MTNSAQIQYRVRIAAKCLAAVLAVSVPLAAAEQVSNGGAQVPARTLPVPETVSPQVQKLIAAPLRPN
jgi:hypothetical protein